MLRLRVTLVTRLPVFTAQTFHALELSKISGHNYQSATARVSSNQQVITAD